MIRTVTGTYHTTATAGETVRVFVPQDLPPERGLDLPNPKLKSGPCPMVYSNGVLNCHAALQEKGPAVVTGRSGTLGKVTFVEDDYWPHNTSLWVTNPSLSSISTQDLDLSASPPIQLYQHSTSTMPKLAKC